MIEHTRQRDSRAGKTKEGREEKVLRKLGACCVSTEEKICFNQESVMGLKCETCKILPFISLGSED